MSNKNSASTDIRSYLEKNQIKQRTSVPSIYGVFFNLSENAVLSYTCTDPHFQM